MKVIEGVINGERALIGMDRKYLKVCTARSSFSLEEIASSTVCSASKGTGETGTSLYGAERARKNTDSLAGAAIVELKMESKESKPVRIENISDSDAALICEIVKAKRMISREEI